MRVAWISVTADLYGRVGAASCVVVAATIQNLDASSIIAVQQSIQQAKS